MNIPTGRQNVIIPPAPRDRLDRIERPLCVMADQSDVEVALAAGLCPILLTGTWDWQSVTARRALENLPGLIGIPMAGRRVYIVYDATHTSTDMSVRPT